MRTYKLYASITNANNLANIIIQRNCRVRAIRWSASFNSSADNEFTVAELSTQPISQIGTNDTVGSLDEIRAFGNLTTSGAMLGAINVERAAMDFPLAAAERLYLNGSVTGSGAMTCTCFVDVDEK